VNEYAGGFEKTRVDFEVPEQRLIKKLVLRFFRDNELNIILDLNSFYSFIRLIINLSHQWNHGALVQVLRHSHFVAYSGCSAVQDPHQKRDKPRQEMKSYTRSEANQWMTF